MAHKQGEGFFERIETTHTDDGIDHTVLDEFDDLRESLCHNAETSQLLCPVLQIGYVTPTASVTEQSVLVVFCLALTISAQALGQHEKPPLVGDACHNGQPYLVVNLDHQPRTHIHTLFMPTAEGICQLLQLFERDRGTQMLRLHKCFQCLAQMCPLFQRRWYDILFTHS